MPSVKGKKMIRRLAALTLSLVLFVTTLTGCAVYHTRLFENSHEQEVCVDEVCFTPRAVAFDRVSDDADWTNEHGFWISLRIQDKTVDMPDNPLLKDYSATRDSLSDLFRDRISSSFHVDSLVIHPLSDAESIIALPDTTKMEPRGIDFVTYQFGRVIIPQEIARLKVVFHYSGHTAGKNGVAPDSVLFEMNRIELHRKEFMRRTRTELSG